MHRLRQLGNVARRNIANMMGVVNKSHSSKDITNYNFFFYNFFSQIFTILNLIYSCSNKQLNDIKCLSLAGSKHLQRAKYFKLFMVQYLWIFYKYLFVAATYTLV